MVGSGVWVFLILSISLLLANSFFFLLFTFLVCTLFTFFLFVWRYFWLGGLFWCFIFGSYLHFDHFSNFSSFDPLILLVLILWFFLSILSILHLDPLILCPDSSWILILYSDPLIPVHLVPLILRFYSLFFHVPFFVCLFTHHLINLWLNIPVVNGLA